MIGSKITNCESHTVTFETNSLDVDAENYNNMRSGNSSMVYLFIL